MNERTRRMTTLAVMSVIAYLLMLLTHEISFMPTARFLSLDMKDIVIVIGGFLYGPVAVALMSLVVSVIEMLTVSTTGPVGLLMNVLATCAFACPAAFAYKRMRTISGAVIGLAAGCVLATGTMLLWNYIITPMYMNVPRAVIVEMLIPVFLPFNLIKTGVNAAATLLIYKPLVTALRNAHLLPTPAEQAAGGKVNLGVMLAAALLLLTLALIILAYRGVI